MEMIALDTLGRLHHHGHGLFGWCSDCGSPSRYWHDVKARRAPKPAMFDIDLAELIREREPGRRCKAHVAASSATHAARQYHDRRIISV